MRVGRNPALKVERTSVHTRVTLATIVYIPFLSGYYAQSLDVLKLCLNSLRAHTDKPCELFVFDNGSCPEVHSYLIGELEQGHIDYLLLSKENLGKAGAWNILFEAVPGEVVMYCDSDIFFKPGWLAEHLRILDTFPNVGMVTGLPIRQQVGVYTSGGFSRLQTEHPEISVERGDFISEDAMRAYCAGVSRNFDEYLPSVQHIQDIRLEKDGVRALLGACHFQFVTLRSVVRAMLPFEAKVLLNGNVNAVGSEVELDQKIEQMQLLRLSTTDVYVHHLGNTLTPEWREWLEKLNVATSVGIKNISAWQRRIARNRIVKSVLLRVYGYLFRLYYAPVR